MERLTKRGHKGYPHLVGTVCNYSHVSYDCQIDEGRELLKPALEKLAIYEDLEEQLGVPLKELVKLCDKHIPVDCKNPSKAIVLTDDDVDRWNDYKSAEEQGLLLKLPCRVGDTVYRVNEYAENPLIPMGVISIGIKGITNTFKEIKCRECVFGGEFSYRFTDIGKTVFLTRSEAVQKLKEMNP